MRLWLIVILVGCLAVAGWRIWRGQTHPVVLALVLAPLLFLGYQEQRDRALVARYSAAISKVAGRPVKVRCQGAAASLVDVGVHLGSVRFGPDGPVDYTDITRGACKDLQAYMASDKRNPSQDQIIAVHVLSHEAHHLAGIPDEAIAECRAMQTDAAVARALGASPANAANLARAYWIRFYPYMPGDYRTKECHDGSPLDLNPEVKGWPTAGDHFGG